MFHVVLPIIVYMLWHTKQTYKDIDLFNTMQINIQVKVRFSYHVPLKDYEIICTQGQF